MSNERDVLNTGDYAGTSANKLEVNKVLRNTYALLSMTLLWSAVTAAVSTSMNMPPMTYLICIGVSFALMVFVMPKFANSATGIGIVFAITGLLGFGLGPILNQYLAMSNGGQVVGTALGGTGAIFLALSAYALISKRDFTFMGGMLMVGFLVALGLMLVNLFLGIPAMSLAISALVIMLMSGFILFDTSRIINGGERNYLMATIGLYMTIFNIFISLLNLLGFASDD